MNRDIAQGQWNQLKGKVREYWGRLTDDEIEQLEGRVENLSGKIQEKYGIAKEEAAEQINDFLDHYGYSDPESLDKDGRH